MKKKMVIIALAVIIAALAMGVAPSCDLECIIFGCG